MSLLGDTNISISLLATSEVDSTYVILIHTIHNARSLMLQVPFYLKPAEFRSPVLLS